MMGVEYVVQDTTMAEDDVVGNAVTSVAIPEMITKYWNQYETADEKNIGDR